ncbi:MAG: dihydropteroate synthase, partial [Arenicella sp.]
MGIINVTPDSFSDGGRFVQVDSALQHGLALSSEGADILDVGGESSRPGATEVSVQEELDRVIPIIEILAKETATPVSIDSYKPQVIRAAVAAGAAMINDVNALRAEGALQAAAQTQVPICLMHMQSQPKTMQQSPQYKNV